MLIKEELYKKVNEVRRVNDKVMSLAIVFDEVLRVVCAHASQSGRSIKEKYFLMKTYLENGPPITRVD